MKDDEGVSEVMGYAVIAGVVILAILALSSSGLAPLMASAENVKLESACGSMRSMAGVVDMACDGNNTYMTTCEICVPDGYELRARDAREDARSVTIHAGNVKTFSTRTGSLGLDSAFRDVTFEAGAIFSNDSGLVSAQVPPRIFVNKLPSGRTALYAHLVEVKSDVATPVRSGPVTLGVKRVSSAVSESHPAMPFQCNITVRSDNLKGWEYWLKRQGFSTTYRNGELVASTWSVQDIYVSNTTIFITRL